MGDPGSRAPGALPPPPVVPLRSPPVAVPGERETLLPPGPTHSAIEARVHAPSGARRAVLLCHPHPLYGGSMHSPVPLAITRHLAEVAGPTVAWARFNFRGVGSSGGAYDAGRGEVDDARAVLAHLRRVAPEARISVCGHSFGAWVALRAATSDAARSDTSTSDTSAIDATASDAARSDAAASNTHDAATKGDVECTLLVAPSAHRFGGTMATRPRGSRVAIFIGDKDEFCSVGQARELAAELDADLRVFAGFDHHFLKSRRALAEAALPIIAPEVVRP